MTYYFGFSTLGAYKTRSNNVPKGVTNSTGIGVVPARQSARFKLQDEELVIRDLVNAFNIPQGTKPGKPEYGTTIYSMVFEPNTIDVQGQIEYEVRRVITQDPRIILNTVNIYPQDLGVLVEVELAISPINQARTLSIMFDQGSNSATLA
jgi:phage baseplate assembly protein W